MKKLTVFIAIGALLVIAVYSTFLVTKAPRTAEAMAWYTLSIEMICYECVGQWRSCCHEPCYSQYVRGHSTEDFNVTFQRYEECKNDCANAWNAYCSF